MSKRLTAFLGAGLVAANGCGAAEPNKTPEQGVGAPPGLSVMYANPTVDHVVTYAWWRGFGPKGGDRITLWRHGPWVREEQELIGSKRPSDPARSTSFSNVATAASFSAYQGPEAHGGFTAWRGVATAGRYRLVRTPDTKTISGERCTVWRAEPLGERGVPRRGCIAEDGVVLYDSWLYRSGEIAEERTAVKVERRKIAAAEVLPPPAAMSWAAWLAKAGRLDSAPTGKPLNYDLRLKRSDGGGSSEELRYRGSGGWESSEEWTGGKLERFRLRHSSGRLRLAKDTGQLSIVNDARSKPVPPDFRVEPLDRPAGRVLGEECRWFDTTVGIQDYSRLECRSADGLPLAIIEGGRGGGPSYVAVSISRGKKPLREVMPPPGLLDWAQWGWPDLKS